MAMRSLFFEGPRLDVQEQVPARSRSGAAVSKAPAGRCQRRRKGQMPPCKHWDRHAIPSHAPALFGECLHPVGRHGEIPVEGFNEPRAKPPIDGALPHAIRYGPCIDLRQSAVEKPACSAFSCYSSPGPEESSPDRPRRQDSRDFFLDVRGARDPAGTPGRSSGRSIDRF